MSDPLITHSFLSFFVPAVIAWLAAAPDVIAAEFTTVHMGVFMSGMRKCIETRDLERAHLLCSGIVNSLGKLQRLFPNTVFLPMEFRVFLEHLKTDGIDKAIFLLMSRLIDLRGKRFQKRRRRWIRRTIGDLCMFLSFWVIASHIHSSIFDAQGTGPELWGPFFVFVSLSLIARSMRRSLDLQHDIVPYALTELAYRIAAQKPETT